MGKVSRRPIGIDLFAGAGGMSLGFEQAGFDIAAAVELDPIHACVHKFNFPYTEVLARSVTGLSATEIRKASNLGDRKVDVVFGGAPCQGFSLIGKRALDDPRNSLVRDFVNLVADLDASYFVFENVKGLTVGSQKNFLHELIESFKDKGYNVVEPWSVLNASWFGVPQNRERLFLLGAKEGLKLPSYPQRTTRSPGDRKSDLLNSDLPFCPTSQDALGDLPDVDNFDELIGSDAIKVESWGELSPYARKLRGLDNEAEDFASPRIWDPLVLTNSMRTGHTDISRRRFRETGPGEVEPISRFFKLSRNGISNTLRAGTDSARGAFTSPRPIHYEYDRCITVREMARLHGYPDWFRFHATKWHGARQVGNSVPPPLARAVAASIIGAIGIKPVQPTIPVTLGDPLSLVFDMSQAAKAFTVPIPIGKRDKKSGAKKRKQVEIERLLLAKRGALHG